MTPHEIAQWVIDHRYPRNDKDKVSDAEMYVLLCGEIEQYATSREQEAVNNLIDEIVKLYVPDGNPKAWLDKIIKLKKL